MSLSQQVIEEFDKMTAMCNKMEEIGKVNPDILQNIGRVQSTLSELEKQLSTSASDKDLKSAFLGYHIVRNINLILVRMKYRFVHSEENNDNPIVAEDTLTMLPMMGESIEVAMKYAGRKINDGEEEVMVNHILNLREVTTEVNMKLDVEEESKTIIASPEAVREEEYKLSDAVKQRYAKEEDIY